MASFSLKGGAATPNIFQINDQEGVPATPIYANASLFPMLDANQSLNARSTDLADQVHSFGCEARHFPLGDFHISPEHRSEELPAEHQDFDQIEHPLWTPQDLLQPLVDNQGEWQQDSSRVREDMWPLCESQETAQGGAQSMILSSRLSENICNQTFGHKGSLSPPPGDGWDNADAELDHFLRQDGHRQRKFFYSASPWCKQTSLLPVAQNEMRFCYVGCVLKFKYKIFAAQ